MPLIRDSTVRRLRRTLAPDDTMVFLRTTAWVRDGAGDAEAVTERGPIPARISFDPQNRTEERTIDAQPTALHRHLVELPAHTPVSETDALLVGARLRRNAERVGPGERRIPDPPNGRVYVAEQGGFTGQVAPQFPLSERSKVLDGTVMWACVGGYTAMRVVEVAALERIEITRDVYCDLKT